MSVESQVEIVREGNRIIVEMTNTGETLAYCFIGDDASIEAIADLLSAKRMPNHAMALRQAAMNARKERRVTGL